MELRVAEAPLAVSIKDPETDRLARALAAATGETITDAVRNALRDRLQRQQHHTVPSVAAQVRRIQERIPRLPELDPRTADEIVGYRDDGAPR